MSSLPVPGSAADPIPTLRNEIERHSLALLALMNHRARCVQKLAEEKRRRTLPPRDPAREAELLEVLVAANEGPLTSAMVRTLFRQLIDVGVHLASAQPPPRIAVDRGPRVAIEVGQHRLGDGPPAWIAGPCAVENEAQLEEVAQKLAALGVGWFRAGAFKPRTSPYAFQGLGQEGLRLIAEVCRRYDLVAVTEATGTENVEAVARYADVIQVGTRNMYNYELLRAVGRMGKPVLLKRGLSATLDEWLNAAEYVALSGSEQIVLCERGIRSFGRETRNTLDLSIVPLARAATRLPLVVDVSHAAGRRDILGPLAAAGLACGADGIMVEVHPTPDLALSDAEQQITPERFSALLAEVRELLRSAARPLLDHKEVLGETQRRL